MNKDKPETQRNDVREFILASILLALLFLSLL